MWELCYNLTFGLRRMIYIVTPNETTYSDLKSTPHYVEEATLWFVVFIFLETVYDILSAKKGEKLCSTNDCVTSATAGLLQVMMKTVFRYVELKVGFWLYDNYRLLDLPWDSVWTWIVSLLTVDFSYYWFHRAAHEIGLLWAFHQIHHSSEYYNFSTALRQGMFQQYASMIFYLPECLFVPPQVHLVHMSLNLLYQFSVHTRTIRTLGALDYVFNTPSHHKVHHGRNPYCVDKNYGGFLIIWDRIFGTFQQEKPEEPVVFGLLHPIDTFDQFACQMKGFKHFWSLITSSLDCPSKFKALIYSPSWCPKTHQMLPVPEVEKNKKVYNVPISVMRQIYSLVQLGIGIYVYTVFKTVRETLFWYECVPYVLFIVSLAIALGHLFENTPSANNIELGRCVMWLLWNHAFGFLPMQKTNLINVSFLAQAFYWLVRSMSNTKLLIKSNERKS